MYVVITSSTQVQELLRGPQGIQGLTGPTGATGPQGPKGDTGAQGLKGDQGIEGPQGDRGPTGFYSIYQASGSGTRIPGIINGDLTQPGQGGTGKEGWLIQGTSSHTSESVSLFQIPDYSSFMS